MRAPVLVSLLLAVAAIGVITFAVQQQLGSMAFGELLPFPLRLMNALESTVLYVATSVWPTGLAVFYPHLGAALSPGRALAAATLLIAISAASRFRARHYARHCHDPA